MRWKKDLIIFFSTGFYVGYIKYFPGTFGTLLALILYFFLKEKILFIIPFLIIFFIFSDKHIRNYFNSNDPREVVIDEVIGYFISVLFFKFSIKLAIIGFFIFRIIDIIKPFPIRQFQKLKYGILIDDILAGILTNIIIRIVKL
jgi:phosphatidylglycerophosphatase A